MTDFAFEDAEAAEEEKQSTGSQLNGTPPDRQLKGSGCV